MITMLFWVLRDVISVAMGWESIEPHDIVWSALTCTITVAVMYGSAVFIALKGRATQIEEKAWRDVLRNLLAQANAALGSDIAAADWVFAPYGELEGITPAEAVQYKTQATGVRRLLEAEAVHRREEARSERLMPKVIEGGRTTSELSSAIG